MSTVTKMSDRRTRKLETWEGEIYAMHEDRKRLRFEIGETLLKMKESNEWKTDETVYFGTYLQELSDRMRKQTRQYFSREAMFDYMQAAQMARDIQESNLPAKMKKTFMETDSISAQLKASQTAHQFAREHNRAEGVEPIDAVTGYRMLFEQGFWTAGEPLQQTKIVNKLHESNRDIDSGILARDINNAICRVIALIDGYEWNCPILSEAAADDDLRINATKLQDFLVRLKRAGRV